MIGPTGSPKADIPSVRDKRDCPVTCALLLRRMLAVLVVRRGRGARKQCNIQRAISCRQVFIKGAEESGSRRAAAGGVNPAASFMCCTDESLSSLSSHPSQEGFRELSQS